MSEVVITSGSAYVDIDALACSLSLSFLYGREGVESRVVHTGILNNTIPDSYKERVKGLYLNEYEPEGEPRFVVVDVSDPDYIESFVDSENIEGIYDHHFGFESYWKERIGDRSRIEHVGACATLVWELIFQRGLCRDVPAICLELMCLAIVANTLNFQSNTTSDRDRLAISQIEEAGISVPEMTRRYYEEVGGKIVDDFKGSVLSDLKKLRLSDDRTLFIGQVELLDSSALSEVWDDFLNEFGSVIGDRFGCKDPMWLILVSDISMGKSLMVSRCARAKNLISRVFSVCFDGDVAVANRLWMRKEFVRELMAAF